LRAASFDHLVGARDNRGRDVEAKRFGGFLVDDKLELGGLQDRQIRGLGTAENLTDINPSLPVIILAYATVADQATAATNSRV
jgi:hypothetical protein